MLRLYANTTLLYITGLSITDFGIREDPGTSPTRIPRDDLSPESIKLLYSINLFHVLLRHTL